MIGGYVISENARRKKRCVSDRFQFENFIDATINLIIHDKKYLSFYLCIVVLTGSNKFELEIF